MRTLLLLLVMAGPGWAGPGWAAPLNGTTGIETNNNGVVVTGSVFDETVTALSFAAYTPVVLRSNGFGMAIYRGSPNVLQFGGASSALSLLGLSVGTTSTASLMFDDLAGRGVLGTFVASSESVLYRPASNGKLLDVTFLGTLTPGPHSAFDTPTYATVVFEVGQVGSASRPGAVSVSGSISAHDAAPIPASVPGPAGGGLLVLALTGLGAARRRGRGHALGT